MKISIFVLGTTFVSSTMSFLPALFSIENFIKSPTCNPTHRLNRVCESLSDFARAVDHQHKVSDLHGSWRQLRPSSPESTTYQTINHEKKFALATTLYSHGTRVELVMPFETCRRDETTYFTHAKRYETFADDSRFATNATCSAQSFQLVYASTSLRVDRMVSDGAYRVYVPCNDVFLRI
jgi:hypothetical protein